MYLVNCSHMVIKLIVNIIAIGKYVTKKVELNVQSEINIVRSLKFFLFFIAKIIETINKMVMMKTIPTPRIKNKNVIPKLINKFNMSSNSI